MVRLYCPQGHRFAQFKRTTLIERFGPDRVMPSMLRDLKPLRHRHQPFGPAVPAGLLGSNDRRCASGSYNEGRRLTAELDRINIAGCLS